MQYYYMIAFSLRWSKREFECLRVAETLNEHHENRINEHSKWYKSLGCCAFLYLKISRESFMSMNLALGLASLHSGLVIVITIIQKAYLMRFRIGLKRQRQQLQQYWRKQHVFLLFSSIFFFVSRFAHLVSFPWIWFFFNINKTKL